MPKNWEKTGYLIPENINPDENICICVPVPKDWGHIRAFLGQLTELSKWITWEKTGGTEAAQAARRWFEITECVQEAIDCAMSDGCGCGSSAKPTNTRINPETGIYEESFDGGITWIPAPEDDIRSSGTLFPVIPGSDIAAKKCQQANSVVAFLEAQQARELTDLENNATIADMITGMIGALAGIGLVFAFVPSAIIALLAFVVNTFAHLIADDFGDKFTTATWDELLCLVYCEIQNDGTISESGWIRLQLEVVAEIGDYAGYWLKDHINLIGVVGLNNAANASYPATRDCDSCSCNPECLDESWVICGTVVDIGDGWIEIQADVAPYGSAPYAIIYGSTGSPDYSDYCCQMCYIEILSGTQNGAAYRTCDGTSVLTQVPADQLFSQMFWGFNESTARMRFTFEGSPDCP